MKDNIKDFISVPVLIDGVPEYMGSGFGERQTIFSPPIMMKMLDDTEWEMLEPFMRHS